MDIEKEIYDYMNYLIIERQLSSNTIDAYKRDLYSFFNYAKKGYKQVDKKDIINYISSLDIDPKSINRHIVTLKNYFNFLEKNSMINTNPCEDITGLKTKKSIPRVLSEEDIDKLLDIDPKNAFEYRNKAMLELMYSSGLRVSELLNLNVNDIDFDLNIVRIFGKGSKERIVLFGNKCNELLKKYINNVRLDLYNEKYF